MFIDTGLVTATLLITVRLIVIFFTRAAEHMSVSSLTEKRFKNKKISGVSDHLLQCNYFIDFDHFNISATDIRK